MSKNLPKQYRANFFPRICLKSHNCSICSLELFSNTVPCSNTHVVYMWNYLKYLAIINSSIRKCSAKYKPEGNSDTQWTHDVLQCNSPRAKKKQKNETAVPKCVLLETTVYNIFITQILKSVVIQIVNHFSYFYHLFGRRKTSVFPLFW